MAGHGHKGRRGRSAETQRCQGGYDLARASYEQALQIIRDTGNLDMEQSLLNNLGDVLSHLGCYDQAERCLGEALGLARRLCNPAATARVLEGLSRVARLSGDPHQAEAYARQALIQPDNRDRGWHLTTLASALEAQGRLGEAAEGYGEAVRWWGTQAVDDPVVEPLAGLARVALARGALPEAVAHAEALYRRQDDWLKLLEPLRVYLTCWQVFQATADPRARAVLERACRHLAEQAARLRDPQQRSSFLEQVAVHRELAAAARSAARTTPEPLPSLQLAGVA